MKNIQIRIDEILNDMGGCWWPNSEQEDALRKRLIDDGYNKEDVDYAIKHYQKAVLVLYKYEEIK